MGIGYRVTNYFGVGNTDPAGDILTLIETQLTAAGWQFVEQNAFTQSATARYNRTWKCPGSQNAASTDFYVHLVKNQVAGTYLAVRVSEGWNATTKTVVRPALSGSANMNNDESQVAYGNGTWVVTGNGQAALCSTDSGVTWNPTPMPAASNWNVLTFAGGTFYAFATGTATYATSTDGLTWTSRSLPASGAWNCVSYKSTATVAFVLTQTGSTTYLRSTDGVTWTSGTLPAIATATTWGTGQGFVMLTSGSTVTYTSTDGVSWSSGNALPSAAAWSAIASDGASTYAAVISGGTAAARSTGGTFTSVTLPTTLNNVGATSLKYLNGQFIAIGYTSASTTCVLLTSSDGTAWTQRTMPAMFSSTTTISCAGYGNGVYLIPNESASTNSVFKSTDGATWTTSSFGLPRPHAGAGGYLLSNALAPVFADNSITLATGTSYDVAVLASNSYIAVGINVNGLTTRTGAWYAGLYQPAYSDAQATNPPLAVATLPAGVLGGASGVTRTLRTTSDTNAYAALLFPESLLIGAFDGGAEPATGTIRATRVAIGGNAYNTGFVGTGTFRGWLYDCIAVGQTAAAVTKIADTVTIGATQYAAFSQGNTVQVASMNYSVFFNPTAGT